MSRIRNLTSTGLVVLGVLALGALLSSASALAAPEAPKTEPAKAVTGTTAVLEGVLNPGVEATAGYYFAYSTGAKCTSPSKTLHFETNHEGEEDVKAKLEHADVTELEPNTTYEFCMFATSGAEAPTQSLNELSFTTKPLRPKVTPASEKVASASVTSVKATFEATINPSNEETTYGFEYSTSEAALLGGTGTKVAGTLPPMLEGYSELTVSVPTVAALSPGTTYFYRAVAENEQSEIEGKPAHGTMQSFTTVPAPVAEVPNPIGAETATLKGHLTPLNENVATNYSFDYALVPKTCTEESSTGGEAGKGHGTKALTAEVGGLQPHAKYTVCLVASNEFGSEKGPEEPFETLAAPPKVDSESASGATSASATLHATINPNNQETTKYQFEYSTEGKTGAGEKLEGTIVKVPATAGTIPAAFEEHGVEAPTEVLTPGTTYYYRVVAENATGASKGTVQSFATVPVPTTAEPVTAITATTAKFSGTLTPLNPTVNSEYSFDYKIGLVGEACTGEGSTASAGAGTGSGAKAVSAEATGLQPGASYSVCLVSSNAFGSEVDPHSTVRFTTPTAAPKVDSESTSEVTTTEAKLEALVNPDGEKTTYEFEYSTNKELVGATKKAGAAALEGYPDKLASVSVSGLTAGETYYYRVVAKNAKGEKSGNIESFNTDGAPIVKEGSESASAVSSIEATFGATINPNGEKTTYEFEYSTVGSVAVNTLGGTVETVPGAPPAAELEGFGEQAVSVSTGPVLEPGTTYYYRVAATNASGTKKGKVEQFTKLPVVESESFSALTSTGAKLEATVNPSDQETSCEFQYGTEASLTTSTTVKCVPELLGNGGTSPSLCPEGEGFRLGTCLSLSGLKAGVTYYYRVVVENETSKKEGKPVDGAIKSLTAVTTGGSQGVTNDTATVFGTVTPGALKTTYHFEYGRTTLYGQQTAPVEAGEGINPIPDETANLAGLEPGVVYHYRIVAENTVVAEEGNEKTHGKETVYGGDETFTTHQVLPTLGGVSATGVTQSAATVATTLNAQGLPTRWELQLGTTRGSLQFQASGNTTSSSEEPLTVNLATLAPGTVYYYRFTAVAPDNEVNAETNQVVPVVTPEGTFTTAAASPTTSIIQPPPTTLFPKEAPETEKEAVKTKKITNAEKLAKALKACKKQPKNKRATCKKQAHKKYGPKPKKKKKK
jgi:phosphodiesterase/alkaline phosphatase D-like protein